MSVEEINEFITEEIGFAEESGKNISIRLYISDDSSIEIWFDDDADFYTWSNASCGYEDCYSVIQDIMKWLEDNRLEVTELEVV